MRTDSGVVGTSGPCARWLPQPPGHFYSPPTDPDALAAEAPRLWPLTADAPGIDFDDGGQRRWLREVFPPLLADFDCSCCADDDPQPFHLDNGQFGEVDSGFSTLLAAAVNRRWLGGAMRLTAIEPCPHDFLHGLDGLQSLRVERVQDTPVAVFAELEAGDVPSVDSSHVLKTGSDLVHPPPRVLPTFRHGGRTTR